MTALPLPKAGSTGRCTLGKYARTLLQAQADLRPIRGLSLQWGRARNVVD